MPKKYSTEYFADPTTADELNSILRAAAEARYDPDSTGYINIKVLLKEPAIVVTKLDATLVKLAYHFKDGELVLGDEEIPVTLNYVEQFSDGGLETVDMKDIEIFDLNGQEAKPLGYSKHEEYGKDMIKANAELTELFEPPLTLGHPPSHSGLPKLGIVRNLRDHATKAGTIVADFVNVPKSLAPWIRKKLYDQVSPVIYKNVVAPSGAKFSRVVRSVGLLGAAIPRIKELEGLPVHFAEGNADALSEFCKGGIEELRFSHNDFEPEKEEYAMPEEKKVTMSAEEHKVLLARAENAEKFADTEKANEDLQAKLDAAQKEKDELSKKLGVEEKARTEILESGRKKKVESFVEETKKAGRILPAQSDALMAVADILTDSDTFGEGDAAVTQLDALMAFVGTIPEESAVKFAEMSTENTEAHDDDETKNNAAPSMNVAWFGRAEKYAEDHKCDFETAAVKTFKTGDEKHAELRDE